VICDEIAKLIPLVIRSVDFCVALGLCLPPQCGFPYVEELAAVRCQRFVEAPSPNSASGLMSSNAAAGVVACAKAGPRQSLTFDFGLMFGRAA
jgi:hypothetical protein